MILNNQNESPLYEALKTYLDKNTLRLHMPGHKGGRGLPSPFREHWANMAQFDVTEVDDADDLYAPWGPLARSQQLLAELYGAEDSYFLVNGASVGLMAALLAVMPERPKAGGTAEILLPRQAHRSLWHGCVLADFNPVSIEVEIEPELGLALPPSTEALEEAVRQHPNLQAAVLLQPDYYGVLGDLRSHIDMLHRHGLTVIVDEAHGTHLRFLPDAPLDALMSGADVVIQSPHKTAGALTQTAWMHRQGTRLSAERLQAALRLLHTSSPSFPLLLGLEAARRQLATEGYAMGERLAEWNQAIRRRVSNLSGVTFLSMAHLRHCPTVTGLDESKLYLMTRNAGWTGYDCIDVLHRRGITAEMADSGGLLFMLGPGNELHEVERLEAALETLVAPAYVPLPSLEPIEKRHVLQRRFSPRQAWVSACDVVRMEDAVGRAAAEMITPYPPGIPLVVSGEVLDAPMLEHIHYLLLQGAHITGVEAGCIKVVQE